MYRHESLSTHLIGSGHTFQVVLMHERETVWTSPLFLDQSSAEATRAHLKTQIDRQQCSDCWNVAHVLDEVSVSGEYDTEPDLLFSCRYCLDEGLEAAHAEEMRR